MSHLSKTSKGKDIKAPLVHMLIISELFKRVATNLAGPITPSEGGYKYNLTLIDSTTRFPVAIPLKKIDIKLDG